MDNQLPGLLAVPPSDLTPQTLSALGANMYRYYATAVDGQLIFTLSKELRTSPTALTPVPESVDSDSNE